MAQPTCQPKSPAKQPLAVALHRQEQDQHPPTGTARGETALAEQIMAIAIDRGGKGRSEADLAALLKAVDAESEVPLAVLAAVAEILSYAYRAGATEIAASRARPQRTKT